MFGFIISFIVGVVCLVLGISNMRGNISSLHSYHRHRVKAEDVLPFGRMVGLGTIIIGGGVMLFSCLSAIALYTQNDALTIVGTVIMLITMVIGIAIAFSAMKKYNNGIF